MKSEDFKAELKRLDELSEFMTNTGEPLETLVISREVYLELRGLLGGVCSELVYTRLPVSQ